MDMWDKECFKFLVANSCLFLYQGDQDILQVADIWEEGLIWTEIAQIKLKLNKFCLNLEKLQRESPAIFC